MYLTYQPVSSHHARRERDASPIKARYFLAAFLGFAFCFFGVNGFGGVFSSRRSTSSSDGLGFWSMMRV
jgi:hypothetical protein